MKGIEISLLVLACWAGAPLNLAAQQEQPEGKPIRAIEYAPAAQPLTVEQLVRAQPLKVGQPFRKAEASAAIDKLFASGRYEDIQVDVQSRGDGVVVRFVTKSKRFVGHISAEGKISDPPSRGQLVDAAQLPLGQPFDPKDVDASEQNIRDLLKRNGLYESSVAHRLEPVETADQMNVVFEIKSGRRARYDTPVITGDPKLAAKDVVKATHWRRFLIGGWRQVTEAGMRAGIEGIERKYQKQERLMATVVLKSMDYNAAAHRLTPTLEIKAGPKVKVRVLEAKISKGKLKTYLPIYEEHSIDRDLLVEGARNLRDYFQSQGYYAADIDFRRAPDSKPDEMTVEYIVSKGPLYKLVRVDVKGNKYFNRDALNERLILRAASFQFRHGRYSEAYRKRDEEAIENLYKSNGFRDVKVSSAVEKDYQGKAGAIAVAYTIEEGAQWFVAALDVEGVTAKGADVALNALSSNKGQPFSEFNVAADRKTLLDFYFSNGYPNARFAWNFTEAGEPNRANLRYQINEGQDQIVRDVVIQGLRATRPRLMEKNVKVEKGDPLSPVQVTNSQRQLYTLGIFAKVEEAIQNPDGDTREKYVIYDIEEASRYTLNFGLGAEIARFGPTTRNVSTPTGSTGFSPRLSMDLSRINFLGIGHTVSLQGRVSNIEQRALFNYFAPRFRSVEGRNITFTALYDKTFDVLTFSSRREEASVQVSQVISKPTTAFMRFSYRRVSTNNVVIPTLLVPLLVQPIRIGVLSANLVQDRRDNPATTTRGIYNTIDVGLASRIFGSQRSFVRALGNNATYTRIGKTMVLARQLTFGAILPFHPPAGISAAESIPLPERFFGGGASSHRGFPYNEAGPRDIGAPAGPGGVATQPTGFPLGGNAVLFHKTELRFPLLGENIGGVFFHDMGNVYRSFSDISFRFSQRNKQDFNYMVHAPGFGIRYKTPLGPIRADFAYNINPPSFVGFKGTIQQLLTCNPNPLPGQPVQSFCVGVPRSISHFQFSFSIGQTF